MPPDMYINIYGKLVVVLYSVLNQVGEKSILTSGAFKTTRIRGKNDVKSWRQGYWGRRIQALGWSQSIRLGIPSCMTVQSDFFPVRAVFFPRVPSFLEGTEVGSQRFLSSEFPVVLNAALLWLIASKCHLTSHDMTSTPTWYILTRLC